MPSSHRLDTQLVHAGDPKPRIGGSAVVPIFQSTVFEHSGGGDYHTIPYPRLSNLPNHQALREKLAVLEGAEDALVTGSGMAAISAAVMSVASGGGHILTQDCLYGGTQSFFKKDLPAWGMGHSTIDAADPSSWSAALRPNTKAIYVEAMTNPLLQVIDHRAVVDFAERHGLVSIIDSTFSTPVNFRAAAFGYDLSVHSATKYLNGHTDLTAGAIAGRGELVKRAKSVLDHLGGTLDPLLCYLLQRGMRTLGVRVRHQNASAQRIAEFLESRREVLRVNYAGLESHPQHAMARELFQGFGGVLSFEFDGDVDATLAFIDRCELAVHGPSLGGSETLMSMPARLSHASLSPEEREAMGVADTLVRMSVGLEDSEDLIEDLTRALEAR